MIGDAAEWVLPKELPLFPLNGVLLLPRGILPLNVFEPRYLAMVDAALAGDHMIGIVQPAAEGVSGLSAPDGTNLYRTGCIGGIRGFEKTDDGRYMIELHGLSRFEIIEELAMRDGYRRIQPDYTRFAADIQPRSDTPTERERLLSSLRGYFELRSITVDWETLIKTSDEHLITTLAMVCPFDPTEKQGLLESPDIAQQCKMLIGFIESALRCDNGNGNPTLN